MALLGTYSFHGSDPVNGCRFIAQRLEAFRVDVNTVKTARRSFRGRLSAGLGGAKGNWVVALKGTTYLNVTPVSCTTNHSRLVISWFV
jgi:hypothetical protein